MDPASGGPDAHPRHRLPAGTPCWVDDAAADLPAAHEFYGSMFGFTFTEIPKAGGSTTFATTGDPLGGLGPALNGSPTGWTTCFAVTSADDAAAYATGEGGAVLV
ncbi:MAG: hypothetical protein H7233_13405, partial [Pseudorhodobacter sp.]|nr:hypothetical protein [Frankiaceae bacterium]